MSSITDAFLDLLDLLDRLVKVVCIFIACIMTAVVIMQVITRYLPIPTPRWTEELARYLMISMAYIGASSMIKRWKNIYVDYFLNKLPPKIYRIVMFIMQILILGFILYIFYLSIEVFPVTGTRQISATLGIPMLVPQSSIIVGTFLMALQLIGVIIRSFRGDQKK